MSTHYIVAAYLGERRLDHPPHKANRLLFLQEHFASLARLQHAIDRVTVVVQTDPNSVECGGRANLDRMLAAVVPPDVNVMIRPNDIGLSYSALRDAAKAEYEYTIFNEDDYVFTIDHFDRFLVDLIAPRADVSLVCGLAGNRHSAVSMGIMRSSTLMDFPVSTVNDGRPQLLWSDQMFQRGQITDWLPYYACVYWQDEGVVRWFERTRANALGAYPPDAMASPPDYEWRRSLVVPIQALDHDVYVHYWNTEVAHWVRRLGRIDRAGNLEWRSGEEP